LFFIPTYSTPDIQVFMKRSGSFASSLFYCIFVLCEAAMERFYPNAKARERLKLRISALNKEGYGSQPLS